MVDGKSTSAKSGLEFTTPGFPALQAHVPSLSPPPAPWKYHGAEASAPSQYCVSTSLLQHRHGNRLHMKHSHSSKPCSAVPRAPLSSHRCPPHLPSLHLPSCFQRGRKVNTCPMQTAAQRGAASSVPTGDGPHQAWRPLHCSLSGWDHGSTAEETRITYCQHHAPQEACNSDKEVGDRAAPH